MAARPLSYCLRPMVTITACGSIPTNPLRLFNANDGGVTISVDGGKTWTQQDNQPTAQFYHVAVGQSLALSCVRRAAGQHDRGHRQPDR